MCGRVVGWGKKHRRGWGPVVGVRGAGDLSGEGVVQEAEPKEE